MGEKKGTEMNATITVRKLHEASKSNDGYNNNPDECLDIVERLRIEAGKLIYDYPTTFQKVIKVIRSK
jgi:hypothetical protein